MRGSVAVLLADCHHLVRHGHAIEVLAAFDDAGSDLARTGRVAGHANTPWEWLAMGLVAQALAAPDGIEHTRQVPPGVGGADVVHLGPGFGFAPDIGAA